MPSEPTVIAALAALLDDDVAARWIAEHPAEAVAALDRQR